MAEPVVKETKITRFGFFSGVTRFLSWLIPYLEKRLSKTLNRELNSFILGLEGAQKHLAELDENNAMLLLKDTKRIIGIIESFENELKKDNYLNDPLLKDKFKYLLSTLYKFESLLHKIAYSNAPVEKTDEQIKKGIIKTNRKNLAKLC